MDLRCTLPPSPLRRPPTHASQPACPMVSRRTSSAFAPSRFTTGIAGSSLYDEPMRTWWTVLGAACAACSGPSSHASSDAATGRDAARHDATTGDTVAADAPPAPGPITIAMYDNGGPLPGQHVFFGAPDG